MRRAAAGVLQDCPGVAYLAGLGTANCAAFCPGLGTVNCKVYYSVQRLSLTPLLRHPAPLRRLSAASYCE
eukprot:6214080-Pleurochrysis_carterae.AAC.3